MQVSKQRCQSRQRQCPDRSHYQQLRPCLAFQFFADKPPRNFFLADRFTVLSRESHTLIPPSASALPRPSPVIVRNFVSVSSSRASPCRCLMAATASTAVT